MITIPKSGRSAFSDFAFLKILSKLSIVRTMQVKAYFFLLLFLLFNWNYKLKLIIYSDLIRWLS